LHYASRSKPEILKLLLSNGAKVDVQDFSGFTPLMRAVTNKNLATFELLLQAGSNPFIENKNSKDSVDLVIINSNVEMFKFLVNPLSIAHSENLSLFQKKLEGSDDALLQQVLNQKITQIENRVLERIAEFGNNASSVKSGPFTFSDLQDFPCYEVINVGAGEGGCITVSDKLSDRAGTQEGSVKLEALADVSVSVEQEKAAVLPEIVVSDLAVIPITVVEADMQDVLTVSKSDYSVIAAVPVSFGAANKSGIYTDILTKNTLSYDQVQNSYEELNYLSNQEWAYGKNVPTNIISYSVLASYYGKKSETKPSYHQDEAYLKAQEALSKRNKLLAVAPIIKQSDEMHEAGFYIQSGSFIYPKNSATLQKSLGRYGNVFVVEKLIEERNFHVVYVGPFKSKKDATLASQTKGFQKIIGVESLIRHF